MDLSWASGILFAVFYGRLARFKTWGGEGAQAGEEDAMGIKFISHFIIAMTGISLAQISSDSSGDTGNGFNQYQDTSGIPRQDTTLDSSSGAPRRGPQDDTLRNPMEDSVGMPGNDSVSGPGGNGMEKTSVEVGTLTQAKTNANAPKGAPDSHYWRLAEKEIRDFGRSAKDSLDNASPSVQSKTDRSALKRQIDSIVDFTNLVLEEMKQGAEGPSDDISARIRQITDESKRRIQSIVDSVTSLK
jgi:hypothetical protein